MHTMHTKGKPEQRRTSLVAPAADLDKFREIAEAEGRTFSSELRRLIAKRVAEAEQGSA